ncbi:FadR/GntR family transcriptional regulator [Nocardioides yefusunii]|uniref:FadR/GntR family transcriptional regulator n=1 Tax=Nocardioides yefusunii TaxID=2500546 RepID=A0ABW1QS55_9ACTN|nr:FCD domain-containing protein [Nocardioides yefusunii]
MHGRLVEAIGSGIALGLVTGLLDLDEIAERYAVSRSSIREALRTLAAKGMVVARPKSGTRVTAPEEWAMLDEQVIRWRAAGSERFTQLHHSLELRERLEPLAARRIAVAGSPEHVAALQRATRAIAAAVDANDSTAMMHADTDFHRALYLGSDNPLLWQLAGTVHACLRVPDFLRFERFSPDTLPRHEELLHAVESRDAERAEDACERLVALSRRLFTQAHHQSVETARLSRPTQYDGRVPE